MWRATLCRDFQVKTTCGWCIYNVASYSAARASVLIGLRNGCNIAACPSAVELKWGSYGALARGSARRKGGVRTERRGGSGERVGEHVDFGGFGVHV